MTVDRIKARIMTVMRNLPPLPEVTRQLLAVLGNENASAADVAKVLSSDQALAGKVLKLVNSSFYGVPKEVTTISRAVVILGFTGVRNLALGFGSIQALQSMGKGMDMTNFWAHALANGAAAQSLAGLVKRRIDPEEAFLAGLMHDIGAYVIATAVPDIYGPLLQEEGGDRLAREAEVIGLTHCQVGQGLLQFWELPEAFGDAARHHHDVEVAAGGEQPLTNLVALADILACVHGEAFETPAPEADLQALMRAAGLDYADIGKALAGMDAKIADTEAFMKIAGAEVSHVEAGREQGATAVIITNEDERRAWTETLLSHFGLSVVPMEAFFNQEAGCEGVQLVLVDTQCLTRQQLDQLLPFLAVQSARPAVLIEEGAHAPQGTEEWPVLHLVFSRADLREALTPLTV